MEYTRHIQSHEQIIDKCSLQPLTQVGSVEQYRQTAKRVGKFTYVISGNDIGLNSPVTEEHKRLEQQDEERQNYLLNGKPVDWKDVPDSLKPHLNQKPLMAAPIAIFQHFVNEKLQLLPQDPKGNTRAKGLTLKDDHIWKIEDKRGHLTATFHKTASIVDISDVSHKKAIAAVRYEVKLDPDNKQYTVTLHPPINVEKSTYYYEVDNEAPLERQLSPVFQNPPLAQNLETYKSYIQRLPNLQVKKTLQAPSLKAKKESAKDFGRNISIIKTKDGTTTIPLVKGSDPQREAKKQDRDAKVKALAPGNEAAVQQFLDEHAYQANIFEAASTFFPIFANHDLGISPIDGEPSEYKKQPLSFTFERHPTANHILATAEGEQFIFDAGTETIIGKIHYRVILDPVNKSVLVELDPPELHQAKAAQKPRVVIQKPHHSLATKIFSLFAAFMTLLSELFTSHKSLSDYNFSVIA